MPTTAPTRPTVSLVLPATPAAPAAARRALVGGGLDPDLEHTVSLLVSELVTNAFTHARPLRGIAVQAFLNRDYARVEVRDTGQGFEPQAAGFRAGLGLRLVDKLTRTWGVENGHYTCVWFEVDRRSGRFVRAEEPVATT
ncbi:MAG: ATP-binding protein [Actinobacteria bacterium]|nr:MAG: ATP-binding protein [Actinomycetota bacterium]